MQQLIHVGGLDDLDRLVGFDETFVDEVDGNLHRARAGALPASRLEHVQLTLLHGELDVLHVLIVLLQQLRVAHEVFVRVRQSVLHRENIFGGSNPGDDVLPLRVDQILSVQQVLPGGRVAREAHARAGGLSHVSEHHRLDVHGGALEPRDLVDGHVLLGAVAVPAVKDGVGGESHLLGGLLREHLANLLVHALVSSHEFAEVFGGEFVIVRHANLALQSVDLGFEEVVLDAHDDVAVHVQESAVRVVRELLARHLGETLRDVVVEA